MPVIVKDKLKFDNIGNSTEASFLGQKDELLIKKQSG